LSTSQLSRMPRDPAKRRASNQRPAGHPQCGRVPLAAPPASRRMHPLSATSHTSIMQVQACAAAAQTPHSARMGFIGYAQPFRARPALSSSPPPALHQHRPRYCTAPHPQLQAGSHQSRSTQRPCPTPCQSPQRHSLQDFFKEPPRSPKQPHAACAPSPARPRG
jgi:hypothetical protein